MDKNLIDDSNSLPAWGGGSGNFTNYDNFSPNDHPKYFNQAERNDSTKDNPSGCTCSDGKDLQSLH